MNPVQRIRLIRKLAQVLNGVDLSRAEIGAQLVVSEAVAAMLIKEGWAELVDTHPASSSPSSK